MLRDQLFADESLKKQIFEQPKASLIPEWYEDFLQDPRRYYKTYWIPKTELKKKLDSGYRLPYPRNRIPVEERNKWRKICAPLDILKEKQEQIRDLMYSRSPSKYDHCVSGKNRYTAMKSHAGAPIMIGMDIKNAFPSVNKTMVEFALKAERFDAEMIPFIVNISTLNDQLPQGPPCSPAILNLVRKPLDLKMGAYVRTRFRNGKMSVYVDNYFVSSSAEDMNKSIPAFKKMARSEGFILNNDKIYIMRKGSRMGGLGLVVSKQSNGTVTVQPNKKYRDRIRATLHNARMRLESGQPPQPGFDVKKLQGQIETLKDTVYYSKYRAELTSIKSMLMAISAVRS